MSARSFATSYQDIRLERHGGAAWLTLDRPERLNATTERMHQELLDAFTRLADDQSCKALVLTGAGDRAFCIGSDVEFLSEAFTSGDFSLFSEYLERFSRVLFALEALEIPTIAMVNGRARAGGFELILACDLVVIASDVLVGDVHTPYGHMPGGGATQRAARKLGQQTALELIWSGRWLTAEEAVATGLALRTAPRERLVEETERLLESLVDKPRAALSQIKRCVQRGLDMPLAEGVALEIDAYLTYLATSDEPVRRFLEGQRDRERRRAARFASHQSANRSDQ
jgi:enoyl-CoA hydratase/carnithine racemase